MGSFYNDEFLEEALFFGKEELAKFIITNCLIYYPNLHLFLKDASDDLVFEIWWPQYECLFKIFINSWKK